MKLPELNTLPTQEEVDGLKAQVELLRAAIVPARDLVDKLPEWEISYHKLLDDLENAMRATPSQCLAEVRAQAGRDGFVAGVSYQRYCHVGVDDIKPTAENYAESIRQQSTKQGQL